MILLDTTVLVYAVGDEHALRQPSREIISAIGERSLTASTTVEVIQEFAHVRARRRDRVDAHRITASFVDLLAPLVRPGEGELRRGLELFVAYPALGAFDAVLAATALSVEGVQALVSADTAFAAVPGVRHVALADTRAVEELLAAPR